MQGFKSFVPDKTTLNKQSMNTASLTWPLKGENLFAWSNDHSSSCHTCRHEPRCIQAEVQCIHGSASILVPSVLQLCSHCTPNGVRWYEDRANLEEGTGHLPALAHAWPPALLSWTLQTRTMQSWQLQQHKLFTRCLDVCCFHLGHKPQSTGLLKSS